MAYFPESPRLGSSDAESLLREIFGFLPRVFRIQHVLPEVAEKEVVLLDILLNSEQYLSRVQKERLLLAASAANQAPSGVALHEEMLKALGGSETEAARLVEGGAPEGAEGDLVRFARKLTLRPAALNKDDVEVLRRRGFTEPQIVEAVVAAALGKFLNTLCFGMGAEPDFAARPIPPPGAENIPHPEPLQIRPQFEEPLEDPDAEWVGRVRTGDTDAFATLVERHSQRVYRTLIGLLGSPDEAKDAMQDTFLKAFQNLSHFEGRAKFSTWLVTIATNTGLQWLRERRPMESLDDDGGEAEDFRPRQLRAWTDDPEQVYSKSERRTLVERSIMRLPMKYRVVLLLRDVQQMPTEDAAAALGLGVPALKARLLRGRLMLREALAPHFIAEARSA